MIAEASMKFPPIKKATGKVALIKHINLKIIIKQLIVKWALFGLIPFNFAGWLIRVGRLTHE